MHALALALACSVYVAESVEEQPRKLEADFAKQKIIATVETRIEITVHSWPLRDGQTPKAGLAACRAKAVSLCTKAQAGKPGPCRFEVHEGPAAGWEAALRVEWPEPKAKKKKRRERRRRRKRRKRP